MLVASPSRALLGGLERSEIPKLDHAIPTTRDKAHPFRMGEKPQPRDLPLVPAEGVQQCARVGVPELHFAVCAARGNPPSVRTEGDSAKTVNGLTSQCQNIRATLDIPNRGQLVVGRDDEAVAFRAERQSVGDVAAGGGELNRLGLWRLPPGGVPHG